MYFRRIAAHLLVIFFLAITLDAFAYTMFRVHSGVLPWGVVRYFYALMAPYQGFRIWNMDLLAEGKREDGSWERIDLAPYYPSYSRGQTNVRQELLMLHWRGQAWGDPTFRHRTYESLALRLQQEEAKRGRPYVAIRLTWEEWPPSPAGYEFLRRDPYMKRWPLAQIP